MSCPESKDKEAKDDDSESIGSDESEDLELDEDEFDRRRAECVADMKELEMLFNNLKEAMIAEKQLLIQQKAKELDEETAEEFTVPLHKLKQNMEIKLKLAGVMKDYKNKNVDHTYEYEEMSIKQSLEDDKLRIYDKYMTKLESDIKQLEERRHQFLLDYHWYQMAANGLGINDLIEKSEPVESDEKRPKVVGSTAAVAASSTSQHNPNEPFVVYSLTDYEIMEDLCAIKMYSNLKSISTKI